MLAADPNVDSVLCRVDFDSEGNAVVVPAFFHPKQTHIVCRAIVAKGMLVFEAAVPVGIYPYAIALFVPKHPNGERELLGFGIVFGTKHQVCLEYTEVVCAVFRRDPGSARSVKPTVPCLGRIAEAHPSAIVVRCGKRAEVSNLRHCLSCCIHRLLQRWM